MTSERGIGSDTPLTEILASEDGIREALKQAPWDVRVAIESTSAATIVFDKLGNQNLPQYLPSNDPVGQILTSMYDLDIKHQKLWQNQGYVPIVGATIMRERNQLYQEIAQQIKRNQKYYFFEEMLNRSLNRELPEEIRALLASDIATAHLLVGREDRVLVGLKGGVFWKQIEWPSLPDDTAPHIRTSSFYLAMAPQIGRREMEVVPDKPLIPEVSEKMTIPDPIQSVDEALEQAYYGQKFIIPYEGAEVRFRKAGDLDKVILLQAKNILFGKIVTDKGDALTAIDLENGTVLSDLKNQPFGEILAEVYRDMVTAVEVYADRPRKLRNLGIVSGNDDIDTVEIPSVIYIPRTSRVRNGEDFRPKYTGPVRPTTPHRVSGHRRHVPMSEQHRQVLLKFEEETGISILENLPIGYTFVRPHVVPNDVHIADLPVFIKKKIETQLKQDLHKSIKEDYEFEEDEPKEDIEQMHEGEAIDVQGRRFPFRFPKFGRD